MDGEKTAARGADGECFSSGGGEVVLGGESGIGGGGGY